MDNINIINEEFKVLNASNDENSGKIISATNMEVVDMLVEHALSDKTYEMSSDNIDNEAKIIQSEYDAANEEEDSIFIAANNELEGTDYMRDFLGKYYIIQGKGNTDKINYIQEFFDDFSKNKADQFEAESDFFLNDNAGYFTIYSDETKEKQKAINADIAIKLKGFVKDYLQKYKFENNNQSELAKYKEEKKFKTDKLRQRLDYYSKKGEREKDIKNDLATYIKATEQLYEYLYELKNVGVYDQVRIDTLMNQYYVSYEHLRIDKEMQLDIIKREKKFSKDFERINQFKKINDNEKRINLDSTNKNINEKFIMCLKNKEYGKIVSEKNIDIVLTNPDNYFSRHDSEIIKNITHDSKGKVDFDGYMGDAVKLSPEAKDFLAIAVYSKITKTNKEGTVSKLPEYNNMGVAPLMLRAINILEDNFVPSIEVAEEFCAMREKLASQEEFDYRIKKAKVMYESIKEEINSEKFKNSVEKFLDNNMSPEDWGVLYGAATDYISEIRKKKNLTKEDEERLSFADTLFDLIKEEITRTDLGYDRKKYNWGQDINYGIDYNDNETKSKINIVNPQKLNLEMDLAKVQKTSISKEQFDQFINEKNIDKLSDYKMYIQVLSRPNEYFDKHDSDIIKKMMSDARQDVVKLSKMNFEQLSEKGKTFFAGISLSQLSIDKENKLDNSNNIPNYNLLQSLDLIRNSGNISYDLNDRIKEMEEKVLSKEYISEMKTMFLDKMDKIKDGFLNSNEFTDFSEDVNTVLKKSDMTIDELVKLSKSCTNYIKAKGDSPKSTEKGQARYDLARSILDFTNQLTYKRNDNDIDKYKFANFAEEMEQIKSGWNNSTEFTDFKNKFEEAFRDIGNNNIDVKDRLKNLATACDTYINAKGDSKKSTEKGQRRYDLAKQILNYTNVIIDRDKNKDINIDINIDINNEAVVNDKASKSKESKENKEPNKKEIKNKELCPIAQLEKEDKEEKKVKVKRSNTLGVKNSGKFKTNSKENFKRSNSMTVTQSNKKSKTAGNEGMKMPK